MLATISEYWFTTLPAIITGIFLLRKLKKTREEMAARALVPATIVRKK